jgi:hypothetical protein
MTYLTRKFSQVEKSLGIKPYDDDGKIESIETQLEILKGVVIVLIGILETEGVLSLENSDKLDRVRYAASLDSIHEDRK